jgi:hypothetical protein
MKGALTRFCARKQSRRDGAPVSDPARFKRVRRGRSKPGISTARGECPGPNRLLARTNAAQLPLGSPHGIWLAHGAK